MKLGVLLSALDTMIPFSLAAKWDNVGLMLGDPAREINKIGIAMDPLFECVQAAVEQGCDLLLVHHPMFFTSLKQLDLSREPGRTVALAAQKNVAIVAMHTNWDCVDGGVSWVLAGLLGLTNTAALEPDTGLGVIGELSQRTSPRDVLLQAKQAWGLSRADGYFPRELQVKRVALCGGSGADLWKRALSMNAELYITADAKYHTLLDACREGLAFGVVDHAEMERASLPALAERLRVSMGVDVCVIDFLGLFPPERL